MSMINTNVPMFKCRIGSLVSIDQPCKKIFMFLPKCSFICMTKRQSHLPKLSTCASVLSGAYLQMHKQAIISNNIVFTSSLLLEGKKTAYKEQNSLVRHMCYRVGE